MTEGSQEFCLRWNNHQATIISVFDYLLENETLVDCTLAAEGQYLKAHKVVLCACSPYLELLLSQHNDKHPILIFKDIKFTELKSMIEYMYKGEVNIAQDQLNHFLKAAESLQIKGLSESEDESSTPTAAPTPRPPPPRAPPVQRTQPRPISNAIAVTEHPESPKRINRNEAASPSRKRRRQVLPLQGRPSLSGDDASNASEGHQDQSNCDVPSSAPPSSNNAVAKVETNSELMLEPKTEYDDNSVEDITLDDDEEDYSQAGTSMDNSQMNFSGWQQMVGDKSGDEVFAGQDTGAQNSQEYKTYTLLLPKKSSTKSQKIVNLDYGSATYAQTSDAGNGVKPYKVQPKPHWVKEHAKYLRNSGQSYESKSFSDPSQSIVRRARKVQPPCPKTCRMRCCFKFTRERREAIFREFWALVDIEQRRLYIARKMDRIQPKYMRRGSHEHRGLNYAYYLHDEAGRTMRVCRMFFLRTLDVTCKMVRIIQSKMELPEFTFKELRGKSSSSKTQKSPKCWPRSDVCRAELEADLVRTQYV